MTKDTIDVMINMEWLLRFGCFAVAVMLSGCAAQSKPNLEDCTEISDLEKQDSISRSPDGVLTFVHPELKLNDSRRLMSESYDLSYYECSEGFVLFLKVKPTPEPGIIHVGEDMLLVINKLSLDVNAIYAEGDDRPLPPELYKPSR